MDLTDQPSNGDIAHVYTQAGPPIPTILSDGNEDNTEFTVFKGEEEQQTVVRGEDGVWRTTLGGELVVFEKNPAVSHTVIPTFKAASIGDYTVRITNGAPEVFCITEVYDNGSSADVEPFFDFSPSYGVVTTIELDNERYVWMDGAYADITDGEESQLLWAATRATATYQLLRAKFFHYEAAAAEAGAFTPEGVMRALADEAAELLFLMETGLTRDSVAGRGRWENYAAALHQEFLERQQS